MSDNSDVVIKGPYEVDDPALAQMPETPAVQAFTGAQDHHHHDDAAYQPWADHRQPSQRDVLVRGLGRHNIQTEVTSKSLAGPSELIMVMPIRQGFVDCLDTRTYKSRLKTVAEVFSNLRTISRESTLTRPFSDIVDRLRAIYSVHIAVLEPDQLILSVAFDRPWETYIRIVWDKLGALLDPILCNCEGYAGIHSTDQGFEPFAHWIRKHQINNDNYYIMGNHTVDDILYLDQIEKIYRSNSDPTLADRKAGAHKVRDPSELAQEQRAITANAEFIKLGVKAITAFHALTRIYPEHSEDHRYLYLAARTVLSELPPSATWGPESTVLKGLFNTEIQWFERGALPARKANTEIDTSVLPLPSLQGGILHSYGANVGCMLLLKITNGDGARSFLEGFQQRVTSAADTTSGKDAVYRNIAFTLSGLIKLGISADDISAFPKEFREGMESRAGLLGDLRSNHPDQWRLPLRNWSSGSGLVETTERVSLDTVDVVIQLRTKTTDTAMRSLSEEHVLWTEIADLDKSLQGIELLSLQAMYSRDDKKEHFGFKDGISQPQVKPKVCPTSRDAVNAGEVFLGYPNDRCELRQHEDSVLRKNGTFLVIRSLAQDVSLLEDWAKEQAKILGGDWTADQIKAKMMGRTLAGVPLAETDSRTAHNDFGYEDDPHGIRCPLQAHIRRAQPRQNTDGQKVPRIIRRGMLYGPAGDADEAAGKGVIFQAYNASIAEQFEVIQRWVSGGNSTGTYSCQSDPLLGVPMPGEDRVLTLPQGEDKDVVRLNLGQKPFVTLNWGCYLFVPSLDALHHISTNRQSRHDQDAERGAVIIAHLRRLAEVSNSEAEAAWKQLLEERDSLDEGDHHAVWRAIRKNHRGVLRTPFGVLVANAELVERVLKDRKHFSVAEYKTRLKRCIGENYLGLDAEEHDKASSTANEVISEVSDEEAFAVAYVNAKGALKALTKINGDLDIPLPKYVDLVLSLIAKQWFGLPDGPTVFELAKMRPAQAHAAMASAFVQAGGQPINGGQTAHCPYHFTSPSRYVFQPRPSADVEKIAAREGERLQRQVHAYVGKARPDQLSGLAKLLNEQLYDWSDEEFSSVLLGALLGFMPTVQGNFLTTMREWIRSRDLWRIQQIYCGDLPANSGTESEPDPARAWPVAKAILSPNLTRSMAERPIPALVHRRVARSTQLGAERLEPGAHIVLGLVSAAADQNFAKIWPVFGGNYWDESGKATHACPAQRMAIGTLLGMISAFFELPGTLRPTPSPLVLKLKPQPKGEGGDEQA